MKKALAENFVPFEPSVGPENTEAGPRLRVVPKVNSPSEGASDFAPLTDSDAAKPPKPPLHTAHPPKASITPTVTLQREGDRISLIRVECSCGQVIELACAYP